MSFRTTLWIAIIAVICYAVKYLIKGIKRLINMIEEKRYKVYYHDNNINSDNRNNRVDIEYDTSMEQVGISDIDKNDYSKVVNESAVSDLDYFLNEKKEFGESAEYCPHCGARIWDNESVCKKCGEILKVEEMEDNQEQKSDDYVKTYKVYYENPKKDKSVCDSDTLEQVRYYKELYSDGIITLEEYQKKKSGILK